LATLERRPVCLRDAALRCTHLDHGYPRRTSVDDH